MPFVDRPAVQLDGIPDGPAVIVVGMPFGYPADDNVAFLTEYRRHDGSAAIVGKERGPSER
jgi:hypothetical protein